MIIELSNKNGEKEKEGPKITREPLHVSKEQMNSLEMTLKDLMGVQSHANCSGDGE